MSVADSWGSDVPVSMPKALAPDEEVLVDFGTHVFTPDGWKLSMSPAVRDEINSSRYAPLEGD